MDKWKCTICGYIYESSEGDPNSGIKPGTAFEDTSDDWRCPMCGAMKKWFEKVK